MVHNTVEYRYGPLQFFTILAPFGIRAKRQCRGIRWASDCGKGLFSVAVAFPVEEARSNRSSWWA